LGEGGASEARGERLPAGSEVDAARLRSGSEPGRRSVSAVSSKSSPEEAAEEDSVELRAGSSDMAAGLWSADWLRSRPAAAPLSVVGR
jgi:hypothetical protein